MYSMLLIGCKYMKAYLLVQVVSSLTMRVNTVWITLKRLHSTRGQILERFLLRGCGGSRAFKQEEIIPLFGLISRSK